MSRLSRHLRSLRQRFAHALIAVAQRARWLLAFVQETPEIALRRHDTIYNAQYYEMVDDAARWSRQVMSDSIIRDLGPNSIIDIGCGTGALLQEICSRGVAASGIEYSSAGLGICRDRGLHVDRFKIGRDRLPPGFARRDVAMSFEVAEHLPARLADRFLALLTAASDVVILSAATPGQGGTDHLNEQPHSYWIEKMQQRGYWFDEQLSNRWRAEWAGKTANWYRDNVMVFRRITAASNSAALPAA